MQDQTYILGFVFACLALAGASLLVFAAVFTYALLRAAAKPAPKPPTADERWRKEWEKTEEDISQ